MDCGRWTGCRTQPELYWVNADRLQPPGVARNRSVRGAAQVLLDVPLLSRRRTVWVTGKPAQKAGIRVGAAALAGGYLADCGR
jgi:hypothetical protein